MASEQRHGARRRLLALLLVTAGLVALVTAGVVDRRPESDPVAAPSPAPTVSEVEPALEPVTRMQGRPVADDRAKGAPIRLRADRLAVDVPVVPIDAADGVLTPPDDPQVLGWYLRGAQAGAAYGSTVVTGHTVHSGGGALDELDDVRPGDTLQVRTARGWITYRARSMVKLTKAQLAHRAERIFSSTVPGRLVLITCTDWNGVEYLGNTVVFADPVARS